MGIDAGFDIVPRLTKSAADRQNWARFLDSVKEKYNDDERVELKHNYILFKVGEHPTLPFEGHKLLRFSSKVSGSTARETEAQKYINAVTSMARLHFGERIRSWDEAIDQWGYYDWNDVHESIRAYEQPDELDIPTPMTGAVSSEEDATQQSDTALFEIRSLPGRGRGLVARHNIPKGARILLERPLLTVQGVPSAVLEHDLASKLRALPKSKQRQFLSLHNNFPGRYPFCGIVKTNGLPCGCNSTVGGVYATICLINHSCFPNSHNNWNGEQGHETIHALRPIDAGEEITISYDRGGPSAARQAYLRWAFGFSCDCSVCSLDPALLSKSDGRRLEIQRLDEAIGDPMRMMLDPAASLDYCRSLLGVLEEEYRCGGTPLMMRLYYDAFQIAVAHGDQARASAFAERAYRERVLCEGEDSPQARRMKGLAEKPTAYENFEGSSRRWESKMGSAPDGVTVTEFERWLWRQSDR